MNLQRLAMMLLIFLSAVPIHAHRKLPKELKQYVALFAKYDPDTIFMADVVKFDHDKFAKAYMAFFKSLSKRPKRFARIKWHELTPLLRGIAAHARYNQHLIPTLARLPVHAMFRELLRVFFKLDKKAYHQLFLVYPKPKETFDDIRYYLHVENETMMSVNIILFMCFVYHDTEYQRLVSFFESFVPALLEKSKMRLRLLMVKYHAINETLHKGLLRVTEDVTSDYYSSGARYNLVGSCIASIGQELSSLSTTTTTTSSSSEEHIVEGSIFGLEDGPFYDIPLHDDEEKSVTPHDTEEDEEELDMPYADDSDQDW